MAAATAIIAGTIISTAALTHLDAVIGTAALAHLGAIVRAASAADVAGQVVGTAPLADMAGGIVLTVARQRRGGEGETEGGKADADAADTTNILHD